MGAAGRGARIHRTRHHRSGRVSELRLPAALAAVAGATSSIGLMTNVLLAPLHAPVQLAKNAASVDQLSGGRLTLGLAAGGRPDDYAAVGRDFHTRGRDFDASLDVLHRAWRGEPVGGGDNPVCPTPVHDRRVPDPGRRHRRSRHPPGHRMGRRLDQWRHRRRPGRTVRRAGPRRLEGGRSRGRTALRLAQLLLPRRGRRRRLARVPAQLLRLPRRLRRDDRRGCPAVGVRDPRRGARFRGRRLHRVDLRSDDGVP